MHTDGSVKTAFKCLLTAFLILTALLCFTGCDGRTAPPAQPTEAFEGNISPRASFSLKGLSPEGAETAALSDGDRSSPCRLKCAGSTGEIIADLGAVYRVCRLDAYPASDGTYTGRLFPRCFEVLCSVNGKDYTKVIKYDNIDAPDCVPVLEFPPADARYVKIVISGFAAGEGTNIAEIAELELISFFGEYAYPS